MTAAAQAAANQDPAAEDVTDDPSAEDAAAADQGDGTDTSDEDPEGADKLGDAGKKALDSMKARVKRERDRRIAVERELVDLKKPKPAPTAKKHDSADGDKLAVDADEIRKQVEAELAEKMAADQARERVLDKIEAKAAKGFADPVDAVAMLMRDHKPDDFLDNGKPDVEAIQDALTELLEKKPYLGAAAQGGGSRFQGSAEGGAKPHKPQRPQSLHEAVNRRYNTPR